MTDGRPNILLIMSDQHRADALGCAGHPVVQTPHLDRLAAAGVRFDRAYCQGPLCSPARASFLTERYVRDHGVSDNTYQLPPGPLPTFTGALRDAGYHTAAIGKLHLYSHGGAGDTRDHLARLRELGFEETHELVGKMASRRIGSPYHDYLREEGLYEQYLTWASQPVRLWEPLPWTLGVESYQDTWVGRETARWLDAYDRAEPFFLQVGFPGPHSPWDAPPEYVERYRDTQIPLGSTRPPDRPSAGPLRAFLDMWYPIRSVPDGMPDESIIACRRAYYAAITLIDEQIGAIVAALEARNMLDDTWIVYTTDHGEMMGDHRMYEKVVFYEPSVRVPLIVRPPGGIAGRTEPGIVEHVDVPATLRDVAGAGTVPGSAGQVLTTALTPRPPLPMLGEGVPRQTGAANIALASTVSSRSPRPGLGEGWRAQRVGVRASLAISENHGFAAFITDRYKLIVWEDTKEPVALFDLQSDPDEDANIVDDPQAAPIRQQIMERYVEPFLSTPPVRLGPHMVDRQSHTNRA